MNWREESIRKLRDYPARKNAIQTIPDEIEAINVRITSPRGSSTDKIAVREGGNKYEDALLDALTEKDALEESRCIALRQVRRIERGLRMLNEKERRTLEIFFIRRPPNHVDILMVELHCEKTMVYKMKDEALRRFTIAMYGIAEI